MELKYDDEKEICKAIDRFNRTFMELKWNKSTDYRPRRSGV